MTTSISVRVDPEVLAAIEATAEQERRTRSNVIRNALEDWVADRMKQAGRQSGELLTLEN